MNETIEQRIERQQAQSLALRNWDGKGWLAQLMKGKFLNIKSINIKPDTNKYFFPIKYVIDAKGKARGVPYVNHEKREAKLAIQ